MDPKEVLKLIDAGFSAEEIRAMQPKAAEPEAKPEDPAQKTAPAAKDEKPEIIKPEEPKKEEPAGPAFDEIVTGINKKIDELAQVVSKISKISLFPSLEDIKPLGIDDVVDKFFKED